MRGDVHEPESLAAALEGVHTAYYLIHSMASGRGYTRVELEAARLLRRRRNGQRCSTSSIWAGWPTRMRKTSRRICARASKPERPCGQGRVPVTEFRAGVIVGPGSISFEMIRFLTECFPILPGPNWLRNKVTADRRGQRDRLPDGRARSSGGARRHL